MRKKLLTFLCAIAASIGTIFANGTKIGDLNYVFDDEEQTAFVTWQELYYLDDYNWDNYSGLTDVVIPSTIEYNNKLYTVVGIGGAAFATSKIKSVIIPNTVTIIEPEAFYDCYALTSVTIPNSVTSIGVGAFSGCSGLTSPVYNAHVFAFMPKSYTGAYTIPDGIESIPDYAFLGCSSLTSITIPNSVTSIGDGAFSGCSGLTTVTIPNSVTSIGGNAFRDCSSLTKVNITDIAAWCNIAFGNSTSNPLNNAKHLFVNDVEVTDLAIPNSVTSIGSSVLS